jgi:hypothetical protein
MDSLTWTEVTPRGVVQVVWDGTVYIVGGVIVPAERHENPRTLAKGHPLMDTNPH